MSDIQFPHYQQPQPQYGPPSEGHGVPRSDRKQAGPLNKMLGKMIGPKLKPKLLGRAKGIKADQNVHIKHKKPKFY